MSEAENSASNAASLTADKWKKASDYLVSSVLFKGPAALLGRFRWPGGWVKWFISIVISILITAMAILLFLNSDAGKRFIADRIAKSPSENGLQVSIGKIEGNVFGEAVLYDLTLSDPEGAFLKVPEIALDWRPLNYVFGELDIRSFASKNGHLMRYPQLRPGDPDDPVMPDFDMRIDHFAIDNLTVDPGVAGEDQQRIDVQAKAHVRSGKLHVFLDGRLGKLDRLYGLIDAEPDAEIFDAKLDYTADAQGILAKMLGATRDHEAQIVGAGSWSHWDGAFVVKAQDERLLAMKLANRSGLFSALGQANLGTVFKGLTARALGPTTNVAANVRVDESIFDGDLALQSRSLKASGKGRIDLTENRFEQFALSANMLDPHLLSPEVAIENALITGTLDGDFGNLGYDHRLSTGAIRGAGGGVSLASLVQSGRADYNTAGLLISLDTQLGNIATGRAQIDTHLSGGKILGRIAMADGAVKSDGLRVSFPQIASDLELRSELASGALALAGTVNLRNFALEQLGTAQGSAKFRFRSARDVPWVMAANVVGNLDQISNQTFINFIGPRADFSGGFTTGASVPLIVREGKLNAEKLQFALDARVADKVSNLTGKGRHQTYGGFSMNALLAGSKPSANFHFDYPFPAADIRDLRFSVLPAEKGFRLAGKGESLLGPFEGEMLLDSSKAQETKLVIDYLKVWKTRLAGVLALENGGASGALSVGGGGLDGTVGLAARELGQGFSANIRADDAQFAGPTRLMIRRGNIDASGMLRKGRNFIDGTVQAEGISYGQLFIGRLAANSKLVNGRGIANGSITGERGGRFNLQGNAEIAPGRLAVIAQGNLANRRITMPRKAVLNRLDNGAWRLHPSQLSMGEGAMVASGQLHEGDLSADLSFDDMPLSGLSIAYGDLGMGGNISGTARYGMAKGEAPRGEARIKIDNLSRSGLVLSAQPIDVSLIAKLTKSAFETRAVIEEGGKRRGRLQGQVTGILNRGSMAERLGRGRLSGQLIYAGKAEALWRLTGVEGVDLNGPVAITANARGSLNNPRITGRAVSNNLYVRSLLSGTDIRNVSLRSTFSGSKLRLTRFAGTAVGGGTIIGSGTADFSDLTKRGPKLDLRAAAKGAKLLDANGLEAEVSGPVRIVSDGRMGTIAGRLTVNRASWKLGRADTVKEVPNIATSEVNLPADIAPLRKPAMRWRYMIDAAAPGQIRVDGMGLDSEWAGDIKLRGSPAEPRLGGQARVVRGTYSFAGTRFDLTRGRIEFDANGPIDPRLDILAETKQDNLAVTVNVAGNALNPEISFTSDPSLPEEELLSRLLFGGSITNLSATDALQLGAALASLRGGGGLDPINQLRNAIGLDRLRIVSADPVENHGTSLAVGKNIGRRTYVEIITDGRGYSATEAEFRITSWLSLLASISTLDRSSAVVKISRDY